MCIRDSVIACLIALALSATVVVLVPISPEAPPLYGVSPRDFGVSLASSYTIVLIVLGLLVGAAVIGGLTLVKIDRE